MEKKALLAIDVINKIIDTGIVLPKNVTRVTIDLTVGEIAKMTYETLVTSEITEVILDNLGEQDA